MTRTLLAAVVASLLLGLGATSAAGASSEVLHSFAGYDGQALAAPLVQANDGFFYGVARYGGNFAVMSPDGGGTIFRTDKAGNLKTLHAFNGEDGAVPTGIVQGHDGMFYGTTSYGGVPNPNSLNPGPGTIFRLDAAGNFTRLFVLPGWENGYRPGPIMQGSDGALYGTAVGGSSLYYRFPGIVYRFDPQTGEYRILHTFASGDGRYWEGRDPTGKLFQAADGWFYGTTNSGGATLSTYSGVVYKVNAAGEFALVHSFNFNDGSGPKAGVFQASDGFFYGTTEGGAGNYGEIFRMDGAGNLTVLHRFGPYSAGGLRPRTNPIEVRPGVFYGVTHLGGAVNPTYGIAYRWDAAGFSVVHEFEGADGIAPSASLLAADDGMLYGTAAAGGANGRGTLFRLNIAQPLPLPTPTVDRLMLAPSVVVGGSTSMATVSLGAPAPAGGTTVTLYSTSLSASVPENIQVPEGAKSGSFAVKTRRVKRTTEATIVAGLGGSQAASTLTIVR